MAVRTGGKQLVIIRIEASGDKNAWVATGN